MTKQKPKLIRELCEEFGSKYTPNQIDESVDLQGLLEYLSDQKKRNNGNFVHIPSDYLCRLIEKHLGYKMEDKVYQKDITQ